MKYKYVPLPVVRCAVPQARRRGVSTVARSQRGFLTAYARAGGNPKRLSPAWRRKRAGFVARHMAQKKRGREPLYDAKGRPTRRHLALLMWAYSPGGAAAARKFCAR